MILPSNNINLVHIGNYISNSTQLITHHNKEEKYIRISMRKKFKNVGTGCVFQREERLLNFKKINNET